MRSSEPDKYLCHLLSAERDRRPVGNGARVGQGFLGGGTPVVRLDGDSTGVTITSSTDAELDITIAASRLTRAHDFALM